MTGFSEGVLVSNICIRGSMPNLIKKSWTVSSKEFTWSKFHPFKECLGPKFTTYGNQRNSFSYMYKAIIQDYIFYKSIHSGTITFANWFELPSFPTNVIQDQKE